MSYEQALKQEATDVPAKTYPQFAEDGTPILDENGEQVWGPEKSAVGKKKRVRKPKEIEYQKDENGEFILDEAGEKIPVKKTRAPAVSRVPRNEASVIKITEEQAAKVAKYSGARGQYAAMLKDGQTIKEYLAAGGDKGFLRFYVRDGACAIEEVVSAPQ